jgi:hypothetical protein
MLRTNVALKLLTPSKLDLAKRAGSMPPEAPQVVRTLPALLFPQA